MLPLISALSMVWMCFADFHQMWEKPSSLHFRSFKRNLHQLWRCFFCKSGCAWERGSVREGQGRGRERWWGRYRLHLQPTGVGIPMQWRQRGGKRAGGEAGGGVKRRGVRWGRAHSVGTLSCGAPRILLTENPSVRSVKRPLSWTSRALCSSPWLTTPWSGCDKTLRGDETKKKTKKKTFLTVVCNKGKMLFCFIFLIFSGLHTGPIQ